MSTRTIRVNFKYNDVLTDPTSVVLSNAAATYGVKRDDTGATVVAAGTAMTKVAAGQYEHTFTEPVAGLEYTAWTKIIHDAKTYYSEIDIESIGVVSTSMAGAYSSLLEVVGRKLFGIRTGFSAAQLDDINDCIRQGLQTVYLAHQWSFLHPLWTLATVAPYATGTVTIASGVVTLTDGVFPSWAAKGILTVGETTYAVYSRDTDAQVTLEDASITVVDDSTYSLGCPEYDLPDGFDAIEGRLTYEPEGSDLYPPVKIVHEDEIRRRRADEEYEDRPVLAALVTVPFDATVGSRRRMVFYPTPDAVYLLTAKMRLRPTMINDASPYPIGGEVLSQVIIEACLAAGERLLDDGEGVHTKQFQMVLAGAIESDKEAATPPWLGADVGDSDEVEWPPKVLVGPVTINGVEM
jgi:hypothetical protein